MKLFILGMPGSGRTTVAASICLDKRYSYIEGSSWLKSCFRPIDFSEHLYSYNDEYHEWLTKCLKYKPDICFDKINDQMKLIRGKRWYDPLYSKDDSISFVIDGLSGPRDFIKLFDYNEDKVIFLDNINNNTEYKDYESISISVIRDYCFWLASADLLSKDNWLEYKFQIPGEESDHFKMLGAKNSVFIVKSLNKAISHLKEYLDIK